MLTTMTESKRLCAIQDELAVIARSYNHAIREDIGAKACNLLFDRFDAIQTLVNDHYAKDNIMIRCECVPGGDEYHNRYIFDKIYFCSCDDFTIIKGTEIVV